MASKRKSDTMETPSIAVLSDLSSSSKENDAPAGPALKKARVADESDASAATSKAKAKGKAKKADATEPRQWQDVALEGEEEDSVPIFDDCNEIRRKIRLLQKTPGWKVTHWLKDIGGINGNSFNRFMKETGPTGGAANGTYYAAYIYFEKVRIAEGKKKTAKRERNEAEHYRGLPREDRKRVWVFTGR